MNTKYITKGLFTWFNFILAIPVCFIWKDDDVYLAPVTDYKIFGFYFNQFIVIFQVPLFSYGLLEKWEDYIHRHKYLQLVFHCLWIEIMVLASSYVTIFLFRRTQIITLVNQTVKLRSYFNKCVFPYGTFEKDAKKQNLIFSCLAFLYIYDMSTTLMPFFFLYHEEGWYFTAYVMKPLYANKDTHYIGLGMAFLFEFWWLSTQWAALYLQMFIHFVYLQTMTTSLRSLRVQLRQGQIRARGKENSVPFMIIYESYMKLRIISIMYNECLGKGFLPYFKLNFSLGAVASFICLVKLLFLRNIFLIGLCSICILVLVLPLMQISKLCSRLYEESLQLYWDILKGKTERKLFKKMMISFKVLGVQVGDFYMVKRVTPLTMLAMISNLAMSLLISVNVDF